MSRFTQSLAKTCQENLLTEKWLIAPSLRVGHQWLEAVVSRRPAGGECPREHDKGPGLGLGGAGDGRQEGQPDHGAGSGESWSMGSSAACRRAPPAICRAWNQVQGYRKRYSWPSKPSGWPACERKRSNRARSRSPLFDVDPVADHPKLELLQLHPPAGLELLDPISVVT